MSSATWRTANGGSRSAHMHLRPAAAAPVQCLHSRELARTQCWNPTPALTWRHRSDRHAPGAAHRRGRTLPALGFGEMIVPIEINPRIPSDSVAQGLTRFLPSDFAECPPLPQFRFRMRVAGALPARPHELTRKAENRPPAPPRAVRGCPKSGCTIDHHGTRHDHAFSPDDRGGAA